MTATEREALVDQIIEQKNSLGAYNPRGTLIACASYALGRKLLLGFAADHDKRRNTLAHVRATPGEALLRKHGN